MNYDITALKRKMLVKYPFFGSVVAGVEYRETKDIETAATDGEIIYYNTQFLENLSVEEQVFVFAHEVCHIAFNHILRSDGKEQHLWNTATDAVINQFLKRDGLKMAEGGVDIPEAINYDAEEFYNKLLQEQQQNQQNQQQISNGQFGSGQSGNSGNKQQSQNNVGNESRQGKDKDSQKNSVGGSGENSKEVKQQDVGHDTHSMWEDAVKKHKEEQEKKEKNGNAQGDKSDQKKEEKKSESNKNAGKDKQNKKDDELEKKQEELEGMGEKDAFKKNREEKKKQLEELKEAISKQAAQAGNTTNSNIRVIEDIGYAKPLIDWRYVLKEAIKYDVDWSYKNATIEDGVVTANLEEQPMPETEIVLDTSGSINQTLLRNFLRECKNILKHSRLKVGCFDTEFYGFTEIRTEKDIENMQFVGGGGTNFDVAVGAFSRRVENKIVFTDGEASMPKMKIDAIWVVFGYTSINPIGGKVIHITPEQLDKLCSYKVKTRSKY